MKHKFYLTFLLFVILGCRTPIDSDHPEYLGTWATYGGCCYSLFEFDPDGHGNYYTAGCSDECNSSYGGNAKYDDNSIKISIYCFKIVEEVESVDTFFTEWPMPIGTDTIWCDKKMRLKKPSTLSGSEVTVYHWKE